MPCRLLSICLVFTALLAFSTLPAAAQSTPIAEIKSSVSIKADFVLIRTADLDAFGINFDLVLLTTSVGPAPGASEKPLFLEYATGYPTTLLFQKLSEETPVNTLLRKIVSTPTVSTSNNTPVTISVNESIPDSSDSALVPGIPGFLPQVNRLLQVQGSLTLTPRINGDHSITLGYSLPPDLTIPPTSVGRPIILRSVASGATLLIKGIHFPQPDGVSLNTASLLYRQWVLLTFITPTIVEKNKVPTP